LRRRHVQRLSDRNAWIFRGEIRSDHAFLRAVAKPLALNFPPGVREANAGFECRTVGHGNLVFVPCADDGRRAACLRSVRGHIEERGKAENIVAPEDRLELAEVGFVEIRAFIDGAVIDAADFDGQRV